MRTKCTVASAPSFSDRVDHSQTDLHPSHPDLRLIRQQYTMNPPPLFKPMCELEPQPWSSNCYLLYRLDNTAEVVAAFASSSSIPPSPVLLSSTLAKLWSTESDEIKFYYKRLADEQRGWAEEGRRLAVVAAEAVKTAEAEAARVRTLLAQRSRATEQRGRFGREISSSSYHPYHPYSSSGSFKRDGSDQPAESGGRGRRRIASSYSSSAQPPRVAEEDPAVLLERRNAQMCHKYYQQLRFDPGSFL